MLKWIMAGIGFIAALIATFIGVVWFLFVRDGDDVSALTEPGSAQVLDLRDAGGSYTVVYRYDFDGRAFYGKRSIYRKMMERGDTFGICVNPRSPAQHTQMNPGCPATDSSGLFEGLKERPEL